MLSLAIALADQVGRRIADINGGDFQVGWWEMIGASVKDMVIHDLKEPEQPRHRVISKRWVGHVALCPVHRNSRVHRPAPANFDHVAQHVDIGWLAYYAD